MKNALSSPFFLRTLLTAVTGLGLLLWTSPAQAEFSNEERAIFAFHKLTGAEPDYAEWIRATDLYKAADKALRPQLLETEEQRLKSGFQAYHPDKDFLQTNDKVKLRLVRNSAANRLYFRFFNSKMDEDPAFPYPYYGNKWVMLLANNLAELRSIELDDAEFTKAAAYMKENGVYAAEMRMRLKPVAADPGEPLREEGIEKHAMLAEIATLEFVYMPSGNSREEIIWSYTAPWYGEKAASPPAAALAPDEEIISP